MTTLRTAAQQALEAWDGGDTEWFKRAYTVMDALRAALAEPVQEPAGWFEGPFGEFRANQLFKHSWPAQTVAWSIPLYLAPPQRKPLTREEAIALWADKSDGPSNGEIVSFTRAIERAHGIGGDK